MTTGTPKDNKKTTLFNLAFIALFVSTIGLLIQIFIVVFITNPYLDKQYADTVNQQVADKAAILVDFQFKQTRNHLNHIASEPYIINATLSKNQTQLKNAAAQVEKTFPYRSHTRLVLKGHAKLDATGPVPLTYAGINLINRAQMGKNTFPEAFLHDGRWFINFVIPITDASTQQVTGVLFTSIDITLLENTLTSLPLSLGKFTLQQAFTDNQKKQTYTDILTHGASTQTKVLPSTINERWIVKFTPKDELSITTLGMSLFPWLIALFTVISAQLILGWFQSQLINKNHMALITFTQRLLIENLTRYPRFSLQTFEDIARTIDDAHSKTSMPVKTPSKPFVKTTPAKTNFIADQSKRHDVLDIEIIEDNENNPATLEVPESIFRAYDIRGIVDETLTESGIRYIGQAIGSEILDRGENEIQVAADGRISSPSFKKALIEGITSTGCNVVDLGAIPTPVMYFGTHYLDSRNGVVITGSHNPKNYNGLKIVIDGITLAQDGIKNLYRRLQHQELHQGSGSITQVGIVDNYLQHIMNDIAIAKPMKVVIDCGNGIAGKTAPDLFKGLGCEVIELYSEVDGNFPNHHPDPSVEANLEDLINIVKESKADIGLAFDGDGDRIGVVTNQGKIIMPDRLLMLFALDVVSRNPGSDVIYDIKSTRRLNQLISGAGGCPIMWKTGHSLMKAKMRDTGALLGGELSGHIYFKERWFGFDDGVYAAARLVELLSLEEDDADTIFARLPEDLSTPELTIDVTDENKFSIIERLIKSARFKNSTISTIDGLRVDFSHGWGLIRASNTTPKLTLRFEAQDNDALNAIKEIFKKELSIIDSSLQFPD